jgi:hypothetical protein
MTVQGFNLRVWRLIRQTEQKSMDWNRSRNWKQVGQGQGGNLTDDDLTATDGKRDHRKDSGTLRH